ncbi:preprotein translocase subunit YajC [Pseudoduganella sp. HUAS MS19]
MNANTSPGRTELYTQELMVNWLGPLQLLRTGMRSAAATTMGAFADPREVQAALKPAQANPAIAVSADGDKGIWVDYLSDTGDGWDSTYSMALCVSQAVKAGGATQTLPAAQVLLLGGDQVYPTPAQGGYRTRFLDPFRAAFPAPVPSNPHADDKQVVPIKRAPLMVATPGNHDWYDGLRGFTQLFCNGDPVGGWVTRQRTSYYVLKLPGGWWIWGLDLQLESAIDRPQREYFEQMAKEVGPNDRVVLCTPEPSWVDESERVKRQSRVALRSLETQTPRFRSLSEIEQILGPRLALVLAGDSHHYARYEPAPGTEAPHRITCGGGGAFLHGTHQLPDPPEPISVAGEKQQYRLAQAYPDKKTSRRLRNRAGLLPAGNLSFCSLLAMFYLLCIWVIESASKVRHPELGSASLMENLASLELTAGHIGEALRCLFVVAAHSPSSVVLALLIVCGCGVFSAAGANRAPRLAFLAGCVHGLLHLLLAAVIVWFMGRVNVFHLGMDTNDLGQVGLFILETLLLGGILGGLLFGLWMVLMNAACGLHYEEVFSSQRIPDHKCFLRMHFEEGKVTIYPLKLEKICRHWLLSTNGLEQLARVKRTFKIRATPAARGPRFVPAPGNANPAEGLQLIEPPITVARKGASYEQARL